jgi:hypothetical protein
MNTLIRKTATGEAITAQDVEILDNSQKDVGAKPSAPTKANRTQQTGEVDAIADIERRTTKVISSEIVEKGNRKGQTRTVTQTNSIEDVEGTLISVTEYEAKVGDTIVTDGGRKMTFKEFKEEFPLDEDYKEILADYSDLNDDTIITVRKVKRTSNSSRFSTVVEIVSPVLEGKMDITIKKDDAKYDAELAALEAITAQDVEILVDNSQEDVGAKQNKKSRGQKINEKDVKSKYRPGKRISQGMSSKSVNGEKILIENELLPHWMRLIRFIAYLLSRSLTI